MVEFFVDRGAALTAMNQVLWVCQPYFFISIQDGLTPLHLACRYDHGEIVRFLLFRGAHVEIRTRDVSQTRLLIARC
jgi:hypothetical protein